MSSVQLIFVFLRSNLRNQAVLTAENLALRQQLAILKQKTRLPRLRPRDRVFWVWLLKLWSNWRSVLLIVQPDAVVGWHRQRFRLYWRWKSKPKQIGRPQVWREIRDRKPPSSTWRTFLDNHLQDIVAIDFFTVPTATFRMLFALVVLRHDRRMIVHFNVTEHPTAEWTAQQIVEAFPEQTAPRFLIRDRDGIYGAFFRQRIENMDIEEIVTARRSPWQNPYVERLIGSIRRECLDHVIVLNERHLRRILSSYFTYYHESRTHLSLNRNSPNARSVDPPENGKVISIPQVGGLHHRYRRAA